MRRPPARIILRTRFVTQSAHSFPLPPPLQIFTYSYPLSKRHLNYHSPTPPRPHSFNAAFLSSIPLHSSFLPLISIPHFPSTSPTNLHTASPSLSHLFYNSTRPFIAETPVNPLPPIRSSSQPPSLSFATPINQINIPNGHRCSREACLPRQDCRTGRTFRR